MNAESPAKSTAHAHATSERQAGLVTVAQLADFDEVIDVRSPGEFAEDHVPGAVNCPVLDNEERARVGTLYKQVSSFHAKKVGAAIVARNIARHIDDLFLAKPKTWRPLIYCWRGGGRSAAMAHIFRQVGWDAGQLDGGYKAYRRFVVAELRTLPGQFNFRVVCGPTGSGKSRLLEALASQNAQVLDLERLAAHRGSVLGTLPGKPQPSQKMFESSIWRALTRMDPARPVFVEAESRKIGALRVPEALILRMWASPCVRLEMSQPARVRLLTEDYHHFIESPELLFEKLDCLQDLHSREKIGAWKALAAAGEWDRLVADLLVEHYDPAYTRSTLKHYLHLSEAVVIHAAGMEHMQALAAELLGQPQERQITVAGGTNIA